MDVLKEQFKFFKVKFINTAFINTKIYIHKKVCTQFQFKNKRKIKKI